MSRAVCVGVLLGGISPEREVSLASGNAVSQALVEAGWDVCTYDYGAPGEEEHGPPAARLIRALTTGPLRDVRAVFIALHGGAGEDGRVQGLLEMAGMPYTGTGPLGSAVSMDKWITKTLVRREGIRVPEGRIQVRGAPAPPELRQAWGRELGWPLVVKPADAGSTVGFSLVAHPEEVPAALEEAFSFSPRVLIEEYIPGREVTVAVLDSRALPVIEIIPSHAVYDYTCKYTTGMSSYVCPAELPDEVAGTLQAHALTAFRVLEHRDFSRLDFRLAPDATPYLLEGNTLPGLTGTSLVPKAAAASGISFAELCSRLVEAALRRGPEAP